MKCVTVFLPLGFGLSGPGLGVWLGGLDHCCLGSVDWASIASASGALASVASVGFGLHGLAVGDMGFGGLELCFDGFGRFGLG